MGTDRHATSHSGRDASPQRRTILITGASSGIGEAFADVFAAEGFDLVITARREDRLRAVAARLEQRHGGRVHVIVSDLAQRDGAISLCAELERNGLTIDGLVNNAGYGVPGGYLDSTWERHDTFLQVMVVAVAELTHRLLPAMLERRYGLIINVASLAGMIPSPAGHTLYGASKAFLIRFSESLSHEVGGRGVRVTALCPGFTRSEFHDVTGTRQQMGALPGWMWMDAATVAREGFAAVTAGTPVYVPGRANRTLAALARHLPQRLVAVVGRRLGRAYRKV